MAKLISITGKALSGEWGTDDETGKGIPVLRTTNFTNYGVIDYRNVVTRSIAKKKLEEKYLRPGDIIIEKSRGSDKQPVGRVVYFEGPANTYLFNNFTGLLRVKNADIWIPKYVFYSLYANYRQGGTIRYERRTTGLHNLQTDNYVSSFDVREASAQKQAEICKQLDEICQIITLRQREVRILDKLIKARFVEMFGTIKNHPDDCKIVSIENVCSLIKDGTHQTPQYTDDKEHGYKFLSSKDVMTEKLDWSDIKYIPAELHERLYSTIQPQRNDILMSKNGVHYGVAAVNDTDEVFDIYVSLALLRPLDIINPVYFRCAINNQETQQQFRSRIKGIGVPNLHLGEIKKTLILLPPMERQKKFVAFAAQVDKSKAVIQKLLDETQTLFDSLMQEYFR